jgi:arginyl-tRNA synthetase
MQERLHIAVAKAVKTAGFEPVDFVVESPAELAHGDYATNVALIAARAAGTSPREIAEALKAELDGTIDGVDRIEIAGPGFINFFLQASAINDVIDDVISNQTVWGEGDHRAGKRIMVEYTQPNPFKAFHIGHLMSNTVGESLARLEEAAGATVARANYQGDVGPHVAKALWALEQKALDAGEITIDELGEAYVFGSAAYEDDPDAKAAIDRINREVYEGAYDRMDQYDKGRQLSLDHFEEIYKVLGTTFDHYFFEGGVWQEGKKIVEGGLAKGIFEESDGAVVYKGEQDGLHTRVFITSAGTPTYETKEIGLAHQKEKTWPFDENITDVAVEQDEYFKVVVAALRKLNPDLASKYHHVTHGMMQLTGGKMSSRKGNVITGESLIADMREKALEKMKERELSDEEKREVADMVAVAAIKYSVLKQATGKNIVFDPEQSLSFEGDSGPYLQYTHVRAQAVLKKADAEGVSPHTTKNGHRMSVFVENLARQLIRFPEIVARAEREREPHHVTTYLTEIAALFNSFYGAEQIVNKDDELSPYKVALTSAVATTLKNGLHLLGIKTPERM